MRAIASSGTPLSPRLVISASRAPQRAHASPARSLVRALPPSPPESRMATVAASLPLRAAARAGPAPPRAPPSDAAFFPGRPWQRRLAARGRPWGSVGWFRAEALPGGAGGPPRREPMAPPYNVLITGSTKAERVESVANDLKKEFGEQHVGLSVMLEKALVDFARDKLEYIDIWINNAGSNAYSYKPLVETSDEALIEVITTNTLGLMLCCREAINMMWNQPRGGHIFNIDDGRPTPRFAAYGATKRSVVHLTKSLQVKPGMVTTDLLMSGATAKQAKFFINILAETADVVADYLVPNIREIPTKQSMKPTYIRFLTGLKAYSRIFSRIAFGARRNKYVAED
ncbi:chlorophyll(ide) b reductase NOL, chloroplastic-like isoform X4 [Triticum urartu]|uniref:chlorophyll(ide) b reductase NOL, chloroplastic-like isoform X4 n=1 Tax=Triticum urartu TaxID=4572 RepID=UPI0020438B6F|nr:chlorophyll(ide) b reductase NOL, chloroplastic-like isoform X4 [Triticum urartu]